MKRKYALVVTVFSLISLLGLAVYLLLFTTSGSRFLLKSVLSRYAQSGDIDIEKSSGYLARTLVCQDIDIQDSKVLPSDSTLKIQRLELYFTSFSLEGLNGKIDNGRLQLPDSDLILFYGTLHNNILDVNLYSKRMNLKEVMSLFSDSKESKKISGLMADIDVYAKGRLSEPKFSGRCQITKLVRDGFSLSDCPVAFDLQLKSLKNKPQLYGTLFSDSGKVSGRKTAVVSIKESKIFFSGAPEDAILNLKGSSVVEGTKIHIELKGTLEIPELKLASEPPLSQERLLVMLATNKSWKGVEATLARGELSADLMSDFVDYFVFSGSGSKMAQQFGITGLSFTYEEEKKGVGVKKEIADNIEASYVIEQSRSKEDQPTTTQRIGGEYKITDSISIGAEKELKQEGQTESIQQPQQPDDKVILKIKKKF
jgi:hypothetical protein